MKKTIFKLLILTVIIGSISKIEAHKDFNVGLCEQCKIIQKNLSSEFANITPFEIHKQICKKIEAGKYTEAAENLKKYIPADVFDIVKKAVFNANLKGFINDLPEEIRNDKRSFLKTVGNFIWFYIIKPILITLKIIIIGSGAVIITTILVLLLAAGALKTTDYLCESTHYNEVIAWIKNELKESGITENIKSAHFAPPTPEGEFSRLWQETKSECKSGLSSFIEWFGN